MSQVGSRDVLKLDWRAMGVELREGIHHRTLVGSNVHQAPSPWEVASRKER